MQSKLRHHFFRYLLAAANKRDIDENSLKYYQWNFLISKTNGLNTKQIFLSFQVVLLLNSTTKKTPSIIMPIQFNRKVGHFQRNFIVFDLQAQ